MERRLERNQIFVSFLIWIFNSHCVCSSNHTIDLINLGHPVDFEEAMAETGFGLFNYLLLLVAIPCCFSCIANSSAMSYILMSAECDLKLSLQDKGTLNAITYAGMVITPIFWGFLSDVLGRKKLMIFGFLSDFCFNLMCASSNSFTAIVIFKFIGGLM
jgi:VNT family MFS transporter (synaptic vesicle glycoprotein 2)